MNQVIKLSDLKPDQRGRLIALRTKTNEDLLRLMQAGLLTNACINLIQKDSLNILFFADHRELAVDLELASGIYVELN